MVNETSRNLTQKEDGEFAEYIVVKGDVQIRIPDNMSDAEAATLGVGITTVVCLLSFSREIEDSTPMK